MFGRRSVLSLVALSMVVLSLSVNVEALAAPGGQHRAHKPATPTATATPTSPPALPTATPTPTNTPPPTFTPINTPPPTLTPTNAPVPTFTPTNAPVPTFTPTNTPPPTLMPTNTPPPTLTPTNTPSPTPPPTNTPAPAAQLLAYWGAYISPSIYGLSTIPPWDSRAIDTFESHAGKKISILHWGRRWYQNGAYYPFSASLMETVRQRGELSLLDWTSRTYGVSPEYNQPIFSLSNITAGTHDSYIRQWATDAKSWGHPFFVRFDHEMNGGWYPWSEARNGNSSGQFVQAWRHVHDIFTQVGATKATWVWCPNAEYPGTIPLEGLYPGDAYVDWTCIDGFNWGTNPARGGRWQTFDEVFKSTYDHILRIAPAKPMMLGEVSASEYGGSKSAWITDALTTQLPNRYPQINALVWFNVNADGMDWVIETSPSAQSAFAAAIAANYYATNQFGNLDTSPIPPPRR